jgi:ribose transport system substrate-binding protein
MADATTRSVRFPMIRKRRGVTTAVVAVLAVTLAASGCGSSSHSSSSATTTATTPSSSSSGTSGSSSSGGGAGAGLTRAQSALAAEEATPTKVLQTTPLKTKPPAGKTIVFIQDDISQSVVIAQGEEAAAKAAGWKVKLLNWLSANPTTLVTAMQQALQYHPVAVSFAGAPQAVWGSEISAYQSAGVAIIPTVVGPQAITGPVKANIGDFTSSGVGLGNWFISDSKGKGDALLVDLPVYPILTEVITGVKQAIAANCPDCKTTAFNGTLAEIGSSTFVSSVVSDLRKNPSIKYVLSSDLLFLSGLSSQLTAAGLTGVKIAGAQPEPADFSAVKAGTESAIVVNSNTLVGWVAADATFRYAEGMPIPSGDGGEPYQLLVKSNVGVGSTTEPSDYQRQLSQLWHIG